MDSKTFVSFGLDRIGICPYPEIVTPVLAVFENSATKEQLDYVGKITKPVKRKFAKLYDEYQEAFISSQPSQSNQDPPDYYICNGMAAPPIAGNWEKPVDQDDSLKDVDWSKVKKVEHPAICSPHKVDQDTKFTVPTHGIFHEELVVNGKTVAEQTVARPLVDQDKEDYSAYEGFLTDTRAGKAATFELTNHPGQKLYNQQAFDAHTKQVVQETLKRLGIEYEDV